MYCFPGRAKLQPILTRRSGRVYLAGDYLRTLYTETVIDQAAERVPVVAQTGAMSTAEAVDLSRHAQATGAAVLMVVAPYCEPLTLDETVDYLRTVADAVDIPIMLYNLPPATGGTLSSRRSRPL
jgi:4-hydroxy-tetrahydrodipicolinate synthase